MINIKAQTCDDAWRQAAKLVRDNGLAQESRTFRSATVTTETLELLHASMTIEDPRQRIVFSRDINPAFAIAECIWILAGSNDLSFINFWNPLMSKFSDNGETLHGAYGYRLGTQLHDAYNAFKNVPHTRQVVLQIWNANADFPVLNGAPRSKDIPCNLMSHLLVRDGKLHWMQVMRSNDLMWGTPYNFIQWTTLQEIMAGWLGLEVGQYTHIASSLHVYENHWEELKALNVTDFTKGERIGNATRVFFKHNIPSNTADLRIESYENWLPIFKTVLKAAVELTKATNAHTVETIISDASLYKDAYFQWLCLLGAEVCRKLNDIDEAKNFAKFAGAYYQTSWLQWLERKQIEAVK